jgi:hypothetical protein
VRGKVASAPNCDRGSRPQHCTRSYAFQIAGTNELQLCSAAVSGRLLRGVRHYKFVLTHNRPFPTARSTTPFEEHGLALDGGFEFDVRNRSAMQTLFGDSKRNLTIGIHKAGLHA